MRIIRVRSAIDAPKDRVTRRAKADRAGVRLVNPATVYPR